MPKRLAGYAVIALVAYLILSLVLERSANDRLARELRNEIARSDTTRRIARGVYARMSIEVKRVHAQNRALGSALDSARGEVVFLAEGIRILRATAATGPVTTTRRSGGLFDFGPITLKTIGELSGWVNTKDSVPLVFATLRPYPLELSFAVIRHENRPWEAVVRVLPYDTTTSVEIPTPQVSTSIVSTSRPVCSRWYTIICDGSVYVGVASMNSLDNRGIHLAGLYSTGLFGNRRLRAIAEISTEPSATIFLWYQVKP